MVDRYISEKALIENIAKIEDLRTLSTKTIGEAISVTPTADVVEVVRCKDCKHYEYGNSDKEDWGYCWFNDTCFESNGFCSYGERK